jgi:hypothetical protein
MNKSSRLLSDDDPLKADKDSNMRHSIELHAFHIILLCLASGEIGAVICLLVTRNISVTAGVLQIAAMVFVSISLLIGARKKSVESKQ